MAINPFQMLPGRIPENPVMQGLNQLAGMVRMFQNPMEGINQAVQNDERMQKVQEYIQQNGGNAQNACMKWANEHGLNQDAVQQAYQTALQMFGKK